MNIAIIIQARMSSSRLPGKSMKTILGKPLIYYVIDRVKRVEGIDSIIVATSSDPSDDCIVDYARENNVFVFRGALDNVQKRYYDAAKKFGSDIIIRVTGDNPLISPELVQHMLEKWHEKKVDYIAYKGCIVGVGAELFTRSSFEKVMALSHSPYEYEHVTPTYYQKRECFNTLFLDPPQEYKHDSLHVTVDTEEDLEFVRSMYEKYNRDGYVPLLSVIHNFSHGEG